MEIKLGEVEKQLEKVDEKIAGLRDKFWGNPNWNKEKAELEARIEVLREWKTKLEASKETIIVMNNGGITQDVQKKASQRKRPTYGVDLTRSEIER